MAYNKILETISEYNTVQYRIQLLFDLNKNKFIVKDLGIMDSNSYHSSFTNALDLYRDLVRAGEKKILSFMEGSE